MSETAAGVARVHDVVADVMATHAARGSRLQTWLRLAVVVFIWASLVIVPPAEQAGWCYAIAAAYPAIWALSLPWLSRARRGGRDLSWILLLLDIVVLGSITMLAGLSADTSWAAYVIVNGFFLLPILAATQLSPLVGTALAVPTVGVFVLASVTTREANDEPWNSLLLRVAVLVGVCFGSIALSRIQRSRVTDISTLAVTRAELLVELTDVEERERQQLSEALHDGALQYVLAARMDLEDVRDGDAESVDRVDHALKTTAGLLRRTVSELHPAVLEQAGLVRAVEDLAEGLRGRGYTVEVTTDGMPVGPASDAERVAFGAVRELVANVVKHSGATSVGLGLSRAGDWITAVVTDDGTGFDAVAAEERLASGHIGLASQRLRVEAAGGRLDAARAEPHGMRMTVTLPA
ncbi:MAG TPA: ATP-binding protein [Lapillicoccus sp.]|nr:ATP-binding protein [Lapillicoccus sp.]